MRTVGVRRNRYRSQRRPPEQSFAGVGADRVVERIAGQDLGVDRRDAGNRVEVGHARHEVVLVAGGGCSSSAAALRSWPGARHGETTRTRCRSPETDPRRRETGLGGDRQAALLRAHLAKRHRQELNTHLEPPVHRWGRALGSDRGRLRWRAPERSLQAKRRGGSHLWARAADACARKVGPTTEGLLGAGGGGLRVFREFFLRAAEMVPEAFGPGGFLAGSFASPSRERVASRLARVLSSPSESKRAMNCRAGCA